MTARGVAASSRASSRMRVGVDVGDGGDAFGRPFGGDFPHPVEPVDVGFEIAEVDEIFGEQRVGDGQKEGCVGPGRDRQPFVGARCGRRANGVDDNDPAALTDSVDDAHHVGCGQQRALRCGGVGAHHDEQVGALDVGYREAPPSAVHQM